MSEKRKKPTERQKNCSYSFPYMGENFDQITPRTLVTLVVS